MNTNSFSILKCLRLPQVREMVTVLLAAAFSWQSVLAVPPTWWQQHGVMKAGIPVADDFAALNQGQLKNFVRAAIYELHDKLPGGAGPLLNQLLQTWRTQKLNADDYSVVNLGQLKAVAEPVYDAMQSAGLTLPLPWTSLAEDDNDYAVANLGQAKAVFAFVLPDYAALGLKDTDGDGFSDALELTFGTNPFNASSMPSGMSGDASESGGAGSGLPAYVNPYPEPWPDFNTPRPETDPTTDTDQDGVPDIRDAVPYDRNFNHPRSGAPHYNIIDLGASDGFIDMADNGVTMWWEDFSEDQLVVWSPESPASPKTLTWDKDELGLVNCASINNPGAINEDGMIFSEAVQESPSMARLFSCNSITHSAIWLPPVYKTLGDSQTTWQFFGFSPLLAGRLKGAVNYWTYDSEFGIETWTSFFRWSGGSVTIEDEEKISDLPPLPEQTEDDEIGDRVALATGRTNHHRTHDSSGTGIIREIQRRTTNLIEAEFGFGGGEFPEWYYLPYDYAEDWRTFQLVTASGQVRTLNTVDLIQEDRSTSPWLYSKVSPAPTPWLVAEYTATDFGAPLDHICKPNSSGSNYQSFPIFAGKDDYLANVKQCIRAGGGGKTRFAGGA